MVARLRGLLGWAPRELLFGGAAWVGGPLAGCGEDVPGEVVGVELSRTDIRRFWTRTPLPSPSQTPATTAPNPRPTPADEGDCCQTSALIPRRDPSRAC